MAIASNFTTKDSKDNTKGMKKISNFLFIIPAFEKLPLGVEENEALKNKRCLKGAAPSSFVLAE